MILYLGTQRDADIIFSHVELRKTGVYQASIRLPINDQSEYAVTETNSLPWSSGTESCRLTFWMFRFA